MMNFCTLFDSVYLSRGLVMYESLKENSDNFHLYIFAFDALAFKVLTSLKLDFVTVISLREFENKDLLDVKSSRTRAEYCWTCTSSVIDFVLSNYKVNSCTYIDSDILFYDSPQVLLSELQGDKSVLITEHRFSKLARAFEQKRAGRFCVQFITFSESQDSRKVLEKWRRQCIDWCYARYEEGKFGDQKYLDSWPADYPNVHILENHGGGVAPWNAGQYKFLRVEKSIYGIRSDNKSKFKVVFFHFHYVRILASGFADLGWNILGRSPIQLFYMPYIKKLIDMEKRLEAKYPEYRMTFYKFSPTGVRESLKHYIKIFTKFNLIKLPAGKHGLFDRS